MHITDPTTPNDENGQLPADPLDVAFIAVGAAAVYDADKWSTAGTAGQMDYIQQCIDHAGKLYAYLGHHPAVFDTVCYAYEIAEEFGKLYGRTLCETGTADWRAVADEILAGLEKDDFI